MIDQFAEQCAEVIGFVLLASWRALPVFTVVAILAQVLYKQLPARYVCWLWLIVIARLLLPLSVESTVAFSSVADVPAQRLILGNDDSHTESTEYDTFTYELENGETVTVALLPPDAMPEEQAAADAAVAAFDPNDGAALAVSPSAAIYRADPGVSLIDRIEPLLEYLSYAIVLGLPAIAIGMLLRGIIAHLRFARTLWKLPSITDQNTVDCLLRICDDLKVGRRPQMKEVATLHAPAVFGLFRPVICLPAGWQERLTTEQLDWVLRHEVAHVKKRDGLVLSIAAVARSAHWFNPLSWMAVGRLQQSMERAADELATFHLNEHQVREYGELLLEFAAGQPPRNSLPTIGLLAMAASKGLQRRIESLQVPNRGTRLFFGLIAVPSICVVAIGGLTDAKPIEKTEVSKRLVPDFEVALASAEWKRMRPSSELPPQRETRIVSIDVTKALEKARELQPGIDAEKFATLYFASMPTANEQRNETRIVDGILTVNATKHQETLIRQMVSAFEQSGLWQIVTELRVIETDVQMLGQFDWSTSPEIARFERIDRATDNKADEWMEAFSLNAWHAGGSGHEEIPVDQSVSVPVRVTKISRLQSERLIRQAQSDVRTNIMQAPKVTMFNGQSGLISDLVRRPYVTDVVEVDGKKELQPNLGVGRGVEVFGEDNCDTR